MLIGIGVGVDFAIVDPPTSSGPPDDNSVIDEAGNTVIDEAGNTVVHE